MQTPAHLCSFVMDCSHAGGRCNSPLRTMKFSQSPYVFHRNMCLSCDPAAPRSRFKRYAGRCVGDAASAPSAEHHVLVTTAHALLTCQEVAGRAELQREDLGRVTGQQHDWCPQR